MNVVIPCAGIGKRLRPHTYSTPKSLLMTGGKPILGHILDRLTPKLIWRMGEREVNRVVFIVGYMGEKIKEYVSQNYGFRACYVEQKEYLGLGHAIWLTRELVNAEPCLIIYGDTIFDGELGLGDIEVVSTTGIDGEIGVKEVEDPRRFGIVELEGGFVRKFVEKPANPSTNLAIVGVNFIKNTGLMFACLDEIMKLGKKTTGEFQLTDALELMVERGTKFKAFQIEKWYDCGTPSALLKTNRELLESRKSKVKSQKYEGSVIKEPVFIHQSAKIEGSEIGPYVSIDKGAEVLGSIISDSIINAGARIEGAVLHSSIIGAGAVVRGVGEGK